MSSFCLSFSSIAWRRLLYQNNKKIDTQKKQVWGRALLVISRRTIFIFPTTYFYGIISLILFCNRSLIRLLCFCFFPGFWGFVVYWGFFWGGGITTPTLNVANKGVGKVSIDSVLQCKERKIKINR